MTPEICAEIIDLLLAAYFQKRAPDRMVEYVLHTSVPRWDARYAISQERLFLRPNSLIVPALLLRKHGPQYLDALSLSATKEVLRDFMRENFPLVSKELVRANFETSLRDFVSADGKAALAKAFAISEMIFKPVRYAMVFPIRPIEVAADFDCGDFYIIDVASITTGSPDALVESVHAGAQVNGWLGVRAPVIEVAEKTKRVVLGALALGVTQVERHSFNMAPSPSNYLKFQDGTWTCTSPAHTPQLASNIEVRQEDHSWLTELARILKSDVKEDRRKSKALQYYYRAWFLDESDRCPLLFMAMDAIFGQGAGRVAVKLREGVTRTLKIEIDEDRFEALLLIRNAVLHGGAPDVIASSKYREYSEKYEIDPIYDLDLLSAKCLRRHIFGNQFSPQHDPHAAIRAEYETNGTLATREEGNTIVTEWP